MVRAVGQSDESGRNKIRLRILGHLAKPGSYIKADPLDGSRMLLVESGRQPSMVKGSVLAAVVLELASDGALCADGVNEKRWTLTDSGDALHKRLLAAGRDDGFLEQHQPLRRAAKGDLPDDGSAIAPWINDGESPLAWLRSRRNRDGSPMLDEMRFVAGERLRADMTRARTMPRITASWSIGVAATGHAGGSLDPTDSMVAAQQRVQRALAAVGPDLAGVLIDVCGFLKGLADVERERQWPARSGKVVLDMALGRLAAHYGLSAMAIGRSRDRQDIESWTAPGARPQIGALQPTNADAS